MSESDKYFQFPLCALLLGSDPVDRFEFIRGFAVVDYGLKLWTQVPPEQREQGRRRVGQRYAAHLSDQVASDLECALILGSDALQVQVGDFRREICRYGTLKLFTEMRAKEHGNSPMVRIRSDIFHDALKGRLTYREFSVLAAIYSSIGDKPHPVRITRDTIRLRALGYHTEPMSLSWRDFREDGAIPLSDSQLRTTIDKLHELKFFARCHLGNKTRETYYSHRMTNDELRDAVVERKTYRIRVKAEEASKNAAAAQRLREVKAALEASKPKPSTQVPPVRSSSLAGDLVQPPRKLSSTGEPANAINVQQSGPLQASSVRNTAPTVADQEPPTLDSVGSTSIACGRTVAGTPRTT